MKSRTVERLIQGLKTSDGDGVKLTRVLTQDLQRRLDPFLMLDAFGSDEAEDYIGGFPDHPHRGFETVTYMLEGKMRHKDSAGNEGLLENGGVQWMTAGRGVIHSEMPEQENGLMKGFQLWVNLPSHLKMNKPSFKDFTSAQIPFIQKKGLLIKVIAGEFGQIKGAVQKPHTLPQYLDIHFENTQNETFYFPLEKTKNAFIYVYEGTASVGDPKEEMAVSEGCMAILSNSGEAIKISSQEKAKMILIAGEPINEPIEQYGPFVMNNRQEILNTIKEYQSGKFLID
jgi:hypothetical protein